MRENCIQNCLPFEGKKEQITCFVFFFFQVLDSSRRFSFLSDNISCIFNGESQGSNWKLGTKGATSDELNNDGEPPEICGNTFDFVFKLGLAYLEDFNEKVIYFLASRLI